MCCLDYSSGLLSRYTIICFMFVVNLVCLLLIIKMDLWRLINAQLLCTARALIYQIQIRMWSTQNEQQSWDAPDLDTALRCGVEQNLRYLDAEILELLGTPMVKTTTRLLLCEPPLGCVTGKLNGLQRRSRVLQETDLAFNQTGIKGWCCAQSVSAGGRKEARKGGVAPGSSANWDFLNTHIL